MISHVYMNDKQARHKKKHGSPAPFRNILPYVATGFLVVVLFWGVDSIKKDSSAKKQWEPSVVVPDEPAKKKDWTQKLRVAPSVHDEKDRPDDATEESCPMPTGNWGHTCDRELIIEGPCNGKCMLKARCQDVKEKFKDTTFEYNEGRTLEIKNVNGLLCTIEDGSPACGVNFHGNMASKNCKNYIPRRHEVMHDGLYAPSREDELNKESIPSKNGREGEPDHNGKWDDDNDDEEEEEEQKYKKKKTKMLEDEDMDAPGPRWSKDSRSRYDDNREDNTPARYRGSHNRNDMDSNGEYQPRRKSHEEEYRPNRNKHKSSSKYDDDDELHRKAQNWNYEQTDRRSTRHMHDDDDDADEGDSMLRGATTKRRRNRYDNDYEN
mmetsp:Transcript_148053/g.258757  ORF Transcript_148053/g.258757 Transcript_148053/m.258757 type:complete len:379 (-) Transcript_148053:392-1528(-)